MILLINVDSLLCNQIVQFSYKFKLKIMMAALKRSSYVETFQFSAGGQRTLRVSVISL